MLARRAFFVLLLALACAPSSSQTEITIGAGTGNATYPLGTSYNDTRTQVIYLRSEIGAPYTFTALSLDVTTVPGQTMNNFTIRMKHTSLGSYPVGASWESTDWTTVYQSNATITTTGWTKFTFTTPFQYNGADNLMVDFSFNNDSSSTAGLCRYSIPGVNRTLNHRTNSAYGDPLTWSGTTPTPTRLNAIVNIKLETNSVAVLTFSPDGGIYNSVQNVTVSYAAPGATIHFTMNGVDPTESDPVIASGSSVLIDHTLTLKARGFREGADPSPVKSATYTLVVSTPTLTPGGGTYTTAQNVIVGCATSGATIHYTTNGVDPTESDPVIASGASVLVDHALTLKAKAWRTGFEPSGVKVADYALRVMTPTFSPDGGTYTSTQNVTVSCSTPEAAIHYTTNGADPAESDPVIASGSTVLVDHSLTLKAKAWNAALDPSAVKSASYAIRAPLVVYVKPTGSDSNDGLTWDTAKGTVGVGLSAAFAGDEIWVAGDAAHPYFERIALKAGVGLYGGFAGTETDRGQRNRNTNVTILDAQQGGCVVTSPPGAGSATVIDGFTIRSGKATLGGGVYCKSSSPTISNNMITGNSTTFQGGAIYCSYSSPVITNNIITGNATYSGGGISCSDSSPTVADNVIVGNTAAEGGGVLCWSSSPTVRNNTITGNSAYYGGGGIYCFDSSPMITDNTISANTTVSDGGGIYCRSSSSPVITNNRIAGNRVTSTSSGHGGGICCQDSSPIASCNMVSGNGATYGGGVYCGSSSRPILTNNTIASNSAQYAGAIYVHSTSPVVSNNIVAFNSSGIFSSGGMPVLRNNDVHGNAGYDYSGLPPGPGDVCVNPLLASPEFGNVHIQPGSLCINAGWNDAPGLSATDIDGQPRIHGGSVDIGADESDGATSPIGPYVIVRVSPTGDDANDGSGWADAHAKRTLQAAIATVSTIGGEVWTKAGTYNERLALQPYAHVYGGFGGTENLRTERNWIAYSAVLDGGTGGSVVTATGGHRVSRIDGFTIRNGSAAKGGGIRCDNAGPTIANNTITANSASAAGGGGILLSVLA